MFSVSLELFDCLLLMFACLQQRLCFCLYALLSMCRLLLMLLVSFVVVVAPCPFGSADIFSPLFASSSSYNILLLLLLLLLSLLLYNCCPIFQTLKIFLFFFFSFVSLMFCCCGFCFSNCYGLIFLLLSSNCIYKIVISIVSSPFSSLFPHP